MSSFANKVDTIPLPFDLGHSITVKQLNGRKLAKAQKAFINALMSESLADMRARGGAKAYKELQEAFAPDVPETDEAKRAAEEAKTKAVEEVKADPLNGFDPYTLIADGVTHYDDGPLTAEQIEELTDEAVPFYAKAVLRISKPSLFFSTEEKKAEQVKE